LWNVFNIYGTVAIKFRENRRWYLIIDNPQILATLDTKDTARRQTKEKSQHRKLKRWTTRDPPKLGGEPRWSQRLGVYVSCKSKTNFRALKDNWIVIWLKQSNFISNAGSWLRPDQEEFKTRGIYYIACPVALIYIGLKHFIWNYSKQTKYNSTTVDTRNKTKERKRHPKHKTNNQEKGIKHNPYFYSQ
jgi:hypothetical protein